MNNEIQQKILEKKKLWLSIQENEREYNRLQKIISVLEFDKSAIIVNIKKCLSELNQISEFMLEKEYEGLQQANASIRPQPQLQPPQDSPLQTPT